MTRKNKRVQTTAEELRRLYWDKKMSMAMLAESIGCATGHINWLFDKWGIPKRNKRQSLKLALTEGRAPAKIGENNPNWKGGRFTTPFGYIKVYKPEHPRSIRGHVFEHILVWEESHGRPLPQGWVVHHINGIKSDNKPQNLYAMPRKNHSTSLLMKEIQTRLRQVENELRVIKAQGVLNV